MSSTPWTWDHRHRHWVIFDSKSREWVDKDGKRAAPPSGAARAPAPKAPASSHSGSREQENSDREDSDESVVTSLKRVRLLDEARSRDEAPSSSSGARNYTAEDSRANVITHWSISPSQQYTDPNTSQQRPVTIKHIRKARDEDRDDRDRKKGKSSSKGELVSSKEGRAIGKIVEARFVPPPPTSSAVSALMSDILGGESNRARTRRFAVVKERPGGNDCFRACAIKTYNGEGVSRQIKWHHSQIYSGRTVPDILDSEIPRLRNGIMERGMQGQEIRVVPYDKYTSLDPMSRLDYCDSVDFDYGDPQVTVFGRVHERSEAALVTQWQNVMAGVAAAIRGPQGIISVGEMTRILRSLRDYAERNDIEWTLQTTQAGLERMAADRELRESTLRRIRANFAAQQRQGSSSSDEDEGEEDE